MGRLDGKPAALASARAVWASETPPEYPLSGELGSYSQLAMTLMPWLWKSAALAEVRWPGPARYWLTKEYPSAAIVLVLGSGYVLKSRPSIVEASAVPVARFVRPQSRPATTSSIMPARLDLYRMFDILLRGCRSRSKAILTTPAGEW